MRTPLRPIVSVVTVVRNGGETILSTIDSVRQQSLSDIEHVIVDGVSSDNTIEQIRAHQHERLRWISEPDLGIYDAMNKGIAMARGEWILFLGADDQLADSGVLHDLFWDASLSTHKLLCGRSTYLWGKKCIARIDWRTLVFNTAQHQAVFYHQSLFNSFRYRIDIPIIADYELNFLAYYNKLPTLVVGREISVCGNFGVSQSANQLESQVDAFRIRSRYINPIFNVALLVVGIANVFATKIRRIPRHRQKIR
ncbi:MAG: glycosyltransferase family 2 protein [Rhodoferax sp.]